MDTGKYAHLTTKQLQQRKKYASVLLVILIAAIVLDTSVLIYNLVIGKGFNNALFISAAVCIFIFIPIYLGKKKIEGALNNKEDN